MMPILSKQIAISLDSFHLNEVSDRDRTDVRSGWNAPILRKISALSRHWWVLSLGCVLCGVSGCAQRMPWNFGHFPMAERMALTSKQEAGTSKERDSNEPPLPSTLVSPDNSSPESQSLASSSRQIKPLTMSDDTGAFVPQSGKYAIPEGVSGEEFAALSRGTPSATTGTTSTSEAMSLAAADAAEMGDPEVAPAHKLPELLGNSGTLPAGATDAQSLAASADTSDSMPLANGMPNPMNSLAMQVDYADATQLRESGTDADIPSGASGNQMEAAPASSLAQVSPANTAQLADVDRFGNAQADSFGAMPVSYTTNQTTGAATSGLQVPAPSAVASALQANDTPLKCTSSYAANAATPAATTSNASGVLGRIQAESPTSTQASKAVHAANAAASGVTTIPTTIRNGEFRPGSTRNAQLPGTRSTATTATTTHTTANRVWPASEAGAMTEVYFTEPGSDIQPVSADLPAGNSNGAVSAEFTSSVTPPVSQPLSYTPSSDVFQR
ncbi:MAG: hypothetical protein PHE53_09565 [Thermoguttaceae bacterium]|nr:hypothetical protein [Thermoguttaceae bacterium]